MITRCLFVGLLALTVSRAGTDAIWDPELRLTQADYDEFTDAAGQCNVAIDREGRVHVVWYVQDFFLTPEYQVFYKRYNPGTGWTQDTCISEDLMARNLYSRFASIATDANGDVHVVWVARGTTAADSCVYYKRCTPVGNGNGGWQDTATVISSLPATEKKLTPDIACSPNGHVHVVWSHTSTATNGIRYRESTDGGSTWLAEVAVFDTAANGADQVNPTIAVAQNNTVHVAWCGHPYFGEAYHLYYRKRVNTTWMTKELIVGFSADQYEPSIAINPLTNNPHIVCRRWYSSNWFQLTHTYWNNTWRTPQVISGSDSAYSQYDPQLAFTADGSAHVVWAGRTPGTTVKQIRYTSRSPDSVWSSPMNLTDATLRERDYPSFAVAGHDLGLVWQDDRGTYQNIYYRHGFASFHDVGCRLIVAPSGTVDSGVVVTPACSVYNYDTTSETYSVRMRIGTGYDQSVQVTNHGPRSGRYVTFPDWTAGPRGSLTVSCSTELSTDAYRTNDRATGMVNVRVHDVACFALLAPSDTVDSSTTVTPACSVANYGTVAETYTVRMRIGSFYVDSTTVTAQAAGARTYATFLGWTVTQIGGPYTVTCSTALAGDARPSNDKQTGSVLVTRPVRDVGATRILAPVDTVDTGSAITPTALVRNYGELEEAFSVRFSIGSFYSADTSATVAAGATDTVKFRPWMVGEIGVHVVRCSTMLAGDQNPGNNQALDTVVVPDIGVEASNTLPTRFALDACGPNPFRTSIVIRYSLAADSRVSFQIRDVAGRTVRTLCASSMKRGVYGVVWDGRDDRGMTVSRGVYYCRMAAGEFRAMKKLVKLD